MYHIWGQESTRQFSMFYSMVRPGRPEKLQKLTERNAVPKVPPALCWCDLLQTARLVPLSLLKDSSQSIGLHLESPKGGGWAEKKQSCTQLSFKKRRSRAEGEGRKGAGASSFCPGKSRAGNVPNPPPQLSNPSPAAVLPGHVSTGSLPVRPKDFLKPPPPAARKSCESVSRRESPASSTPAAATGALGSRTRRPELHSSAQTALRKGETQTARRGCELAAVCHQELLRLLQSGEALGVTSLGSRSGRQTLPCNSTAHPKRPARCAQPSKHRSWTHQITGKGGRGRRRERRGKRGGTFSGKGWVWVFYCYYFPLTCPSAEVLTSTRAAAINQSDRRTITSRVHFSTTGQGKCPEQTPPK